MWMELEHMSLESRQPVCGISTQTARSWDEIVHPEIAEQRLIDLAKRRMDEARHTAKQMTDRELLEEIYVSLKARII